MKNEIISKIESNEDFKILIEEVVIKTKSEIRKNIFDASILNNDKKQMISYYENERLKILKKFNKDSYSLRVDFENDNIKLNNEDFEQLFIYPTYTYERLELFKWNKDFYLEQCVKGKKELFKFHKSRLKDVKNNIWLSYINLNIKKLKENVISKTIKDYHPFKELRTYKNFCTYVDENIIEPYIDFSYLFQRLLNLELIYSTTQKDFFKWLLKNEFITQKNYDLFDDKGQFYSLKKSTTPARENNFNNLFEL